MPSSRRQTFTGRHLTNVPLSRPGSTKRVHHHEIGIEGDPVPFLPGDAVGVHPENSPDLVRQIVHAVGANGLEPVTLADGHTSSFEYALRHYCSLDRPARGLLLRLGSPDPAAPASPPASSVRHRRGDGREPRKDVLDVLRDHAPSNLTPAELVGLLRRLPPRLYSIASSPLRAPNHIDLLIVSVSETIGHREREGVASTWFERRWPIGSAATFYVQDQQRHFGMPADPDTPLIMIGPGTGVAPFRAFLQHRRLAGAKGPNWLFFGDRRRASDFVYEDELTAYVRDGFLRLDLAFSRDQPHKIYVQHRMRERSQDLWTWLEAGAAIYVCGDKNQMAPAVDLTLRAVIQQEGRMTEPAAAEYVERLVRAQRYRRDVY